MELTTKHKELFILSSQDFLSRKEYKNSLRIHNILLFKSNEQYLNSRFGKFRFLSQLFSGVNVRILSPGEGTFQGI